MAYHVAFVVALCSMVTHSGVVSSNRLPRIVDGQYTSIQNFPYMVSIYIQNLTSIGKNCGGTLITPKCVLTTAHCVSHTKPSYISLLLGETYLDYTGPLTTVKDIIISPNYQGSGQRGNDVAILKLTKPVKGENIGTIEPNYSAVDVGETVLVLGWGGDIFNTSNSELRTRHDTILPPHYCRPMIEDNMFCTKNAACTGDSGGPAVHNGMQVGIISYTLGRCIGYSVYAKLSSPTISRFVQETVYTHCN